MLTIYGRTNSVNVQKVLWALAELGLSYERVDAGLQHGKNREPWYLELNPNGRVPLLVDGAFSLWESNTIVRYLCGKHDFGGLYPASPETRADAERWMDWQLSTLVPPVSTVFQNLVRAAPTDRDVRAIGQATVAAAAAIAVLDRELGRRPYVAGERFTMGDIPVGATAYRWTALPDVERRELPALRAWLERLSARAAFREHVMLPLS